MTMFDMALKNMKRSFYNYFLYFMSMVFSVVIYFTFQAIKYNKQISELSKSSMKIDSIFKAASIVLVVFVAIFIWYSNSFFTKKRKKEIALYSMLGVKKNQIGRMLFYENMFMGAFALGIGVFLGSLFTKLFTSILVRVMGSNMNISFSMEPRAMLSTMMVFAILFIITSLHGYSLIYRFKLIELFKAESTGEKPPRNSAVLAVMAVALLALGYYTALNLFNDKFFVKSGGLKMFLLFGPIIIGTYMFFRSSTTFMIKASKNNKARYYKGINMIGISQLQYRLKANAGTLAVVAILSASTLTAIGFNYGLYYNNEKTARSENPFDIQYVSDNTINDKVTSAIGKDRIKNDMTIDFLKLPVKFEGNRPPSKLFGEEGVTLFIMSESQYDEAVKNLDLKDSDIRLKDKKDAVILDSTDSKLLEGDYVNTKYVLNPKTNSFEINIVDRKKFDLTNQHVGGLVAVVNDDLYDSYRSKDNSYPLRSLMIKDVKSSGDLYNNLHNIAGEQTKFTAYYEVYRAGMEGSGLLLFVGVFLGLVFLIATGSIIYFKQLTEANEEKKRYEVLRKIGVSNKEIKHSISQQVFVVFVLPLTIGIVHAFFALKLFASILGGSLLIPTLLSFGAYIVIYAAYYMLTVREYYNIVNAGN